MTELIPSNIANIASLMLIGLGIFFILIGSIGILRLPDFYTRSHAVSKSDTLGIMCVIAGLIILEGATLNSLKLLLVILFVFLANPIGTHALARAATIKGIKPVLGASASSLPGSETSTAPGSEQGSETWSETGSISKTEEKKNREEK